MKFIRSFRAIVALFLFALMPVLPALAQEPLIIGVQGQSSVEIWNSGVKKWEFKNNALTGFNGASGGVPVYRTSVRLATTANGTLATAFANGQTVDSATVATGDRLLLWKQTAPAENGIYTANASGAPTRAIDMNAWNEIPGAYVAVTAGTIYAGSSFNTAVPATGALGTTAITWVAESGPAAMALKANIASPTFTGVLTAVDSAFSGDMILTGAPAFGAGLSASGAAGNDFSGSTGLFKTSTGANTLGGNATTAFTFLQTSASANAFATGLAGNTNPVFRTVNNIASQATGISITGRAATAGADITVLSSGTNENLVVNAKGSGTITLNPTATGNVVIGKGQVTPAVTTIAGDGAITIASGTVILSKGSAAAITLAAPSSQDGTEITVISTTDFAHVITVTGGMWDGTATTNTTATFPVVAGGAITVIASGTDWYVKNLQGVVCAP